LSYDYDDTELEEIRRRKLMELQRRMIEEEKRKRELVAEAQKKEILRKILTPKARDRLTNVRLVRPELAEIVENQLILLAQSGRLKIPVTDEELKSVLAELAERTHRDYNIRIKEKE
jgi:programmed cell death protein 5